MQLELFEKENDLKDLDQKIDKVKTSSDNVRRGLFARHNELAKMYLEMKEICERQAKEIEELKKFVGMETIKPMWDYKIDDKLFVISQNVV